MVKRVLNLFRREIVGLHEAAILLAVLMVVSQFLALIRDRLLAGTFGAGADLDIYYSAFRLPDLIYATIASFVSVTILIPIIIGKISDDKMEEARDFLSAVYTSFVIVMVIVGSIAFLLMPMLSSFLAPGFSAEARLKLIELSRILLLSPILLGLSNLLGSITQASKKFFVYALSPIFYNVGIIIGIVIFVPFFGLSGLVWGVILGALFHLCIQLPTIWQSGLAPRFSIRSVKDNFVMFGKVVMTSLPRTITLSAGQLVTIVLVALASYFNKGAISIFNFSYNLQTVPLSVVGISYSTAAFPLLSKLFTQKQFDKFCERITSASRHIIFWSLPATVLFIVLRAQIVRVILGSGRFDWIATRLTAACLAVFAISVFSQSLILLFVRAYYAGGKTMKPLIACLISSTLTILLALAGSYWYSSVPSAVLLMNKILRLEGIVGGGVLILPLAFTIGSITNIFILWFLFMRDFDWSIKSLGRTFWQSAVSSIMGGIVAYFILDIIAGLINISTFLGIFFQGFVAGVCGLAVMAACLWALRNQELEELVSSLQHKFWRVEVIMPEKEEI